MLRKKSTFIAAAAVMASVFASPVMAQSYPSKTIRLLVPYAAGGGTDAIARVVAQGITAKLGQQVVVENNGSAGGNLATQQAAKSDPDGYTMLMANQGPMVVNPHLFKNVKIDPLTAFDPVTLIAEAPLVVVVPENSPITSVKQLVEEAAKQPGKMTYGSAGNGSASHLATLLLAETANLDMVHAPYKGAGPAITDLLGGRLDFMVTTVPSVFGFIDSGNCRPLAVTTRTAPSGCPICRLSPRAAGRTIRLRHGMASRCRRGRRRRSSRRCVKRRSRRSTARRFCRDWRPKAPSRSAIRRKNSPTS